MLGKLFIMKPVINLATIPVNESRNDQKHKASCCKNKKKRKKK